MCVFQWTVVVCPKDSIVVHREEFGNAKVWANNFLTNESFSKIPFDQQCCGPELFIHVSHLP
jgi:hypothetical protein